MSVSIDARQLEDAGRELRAQGEGLIADACQEGVDGIAGAYLEEVRKGARRHTRTGRLLRNVREKIAGAGEGRRDTVHVGGMVAPIITGGSRAHIIRPIRRAALELRGGAAVAPFAEGVRHPGTQPDPFVSRASTAATPDVLEVLERTSDHLAASVASRLES